MIYRCRAHLTNTEGRGGGGGKGGVSSVPSINGKFSLAPNYKHFYLALHNLTPPKQFTNTPNVPEPRIYTAEVTVTERMPNIKTF